MKPTKNQFFCNDCGKIKMRFETEDKANRFLKFNANEIEEETGLRPERSYYCMACDSWHITSKKEMRNVKSRTEEVIEKYKQHKEEKNKTKIIANQPELKKIEDIKKQENINIKEQTDKKTKTKTKREELNKLLKTIESNIDAINTLKKFEKIEVCIEILNDSYSMLKYFKTTISELEHIYENILSKADLEQLFFNRQKRRQELENTLNLLKEELTNA